LADVLAGVAKSYPQAITGSGHTHSFTLTAAEFTTLRAGGPVSKGVVNMGTDSSHAHTVTILCG
jgi:hypothetical protein